MYYFKLVITLSVFQVLTCAHPLVTRQIEIVSLEGGGLLNTHVGPGGMYTELHGEPIHIKKRDERMEEPAMTN